MATLSAEDHARVAQLTTLLAQNVSVAWNVSAASEYERKAAAPARKAAEAAEAGEAGVFCAAGAAAQNTEAGEAGAIRRAIRAKRPPVILLVAPCRSGTTALSRAVAYTGITVVYQKIKEALRLALLETERDLSDKEKAYFHVESTISRSLALPAPKGESAAAATAAAAAATAAGGAGGHHHTQVLFMKETFGGAHPLESFFDPLGVLLEAGWQPSEIHLITLVRQPLPTMASWIKNWGHAASKEMLFQNYGRALLAMENQVARAKQAGVTVVPLDYEIFGRHEPHEVVHWLLRACGVSSLQPGTVKAAVSGWAQQPDFLGCKDARMHMPEGDSHIAYLRKVHADLCASQGMRYTHVDVQKCRNALGEPLCQTLAATDFDERVADVARATEMHFLGLRHDKTTHFGLSMLVSRRAACVAVGALTAAAVLFSDVEIFRSRSGFGRHGIAATAAIAAATMFCCVVASISVLGGVSAAYEKVLRYVHFLAEENEAFKQARLYVQADNLPRLLCLQVPTSATRVLPSVQIIGAQKSATTLVYSMLSNHPDVAVGIAKESHFFDGRSIFGRVDARMLYRSFFPTLAWKWLHQLCLRPGRTLHVIDSTPVNMILPDAPALLSRFTPDAKIIVILREPVSRALSHFRHNVNWGRCAASRLSDALRLEERVWERAQGPAMSPAADDAATDTDKAPPAATGGLSDEMLVHSYKRRGLYLGDLRRYKLFFGADNLLVLSFKDVIGKGKDSQKQVLSRLCAFVGLDEACIDGMAGGILDAKQKNTTPAWACDRVEEDREGICALEKAFTETNRALAAEFDFPEALEWNRGYGTRGGRV
jgi:hypothetical protein